MAKRQTTVEPKAATNGQHERPVWKKHIGVKGGRLECALWARTVEGKRGPYVKYAVTLTRSYKKVQDGDWLKTSALRMQDIGYAVLLLHEAWRESVRLKNPQ
jgi:hypothetical protein